MPPRSVLLSRAASARASRSFFLRATGIFMVELFAPDVELLRFRQF
jgi:hypothetical protein